MRTREEIINITDERKPIANANFANAEVIEVLLDIRDLLVEANRIEIVGMPIEKKEKI